MASNTRDFYKIKRVGNSVVFMDKVWDYFKYIQNAKSAVSLFDLDQKMTQEEYKFKNPLLSFLKKDEFEKEYRNYLARYKYQLFTEKYKITPTKFKKAFNAVMREIWEVKPYFSDFCFDYKGRPNSEKVILLHKHLPILKKASNESITPIIFFTGMIEEELKSIFCEDWNTVYINSKNKNYLISKIVFRKHYEGKTLDIKNIRHSFIKWNKIKSCVLKLSAYNFYDYDFIYVMSNNFKGKKLKIALSNYYAADNDVLFFRNIVKNVMKYGKTKYDINWSKDSWIENYHKLISTT